MGWKMSLIIISNQKEINDTAVLNQLGYTNALKAEIQPFEYIMDPEEDKIYIGTYNNNLIICAYALPFEFYNSVLTETERKLIKLFPNSEICAVSLRSTVNHFGFGLIKNGVKIRAKAGDLISGTSVDWGSPIKQELNLLSQSKLNEQGDRLYYLDQFSEEISAEHQVGESFVFEILKRYIGNAIDDEDDELLAKDFIGYQIQNKLISKDFFSGEWIGTYTLGEGYSDEQYGKKGIFTIVAQLINNTAISGTCIDEDKQEDEPATIEGFIIENYIGFKKQYRRYYYFDKNGLSHKDTSKPGHTVAYSGLYDSRTDTFRGIWRIENRHLWGNWEMRKRD